MYVKMFRREGTKVSKIVVRENESIEDTLKRFKREVSKRGTLTELRKREHFLKPSDVRKMKKRAMKKNGGRRNY